MQVHHFDVCGKKLTDEDVETGEAKAAFEYDGGGQALLNAESAASFDVEETLRRVKVYAGRCSTKMAGWWR